MLPCKVRVNIMAVLTALMVYLNMSRVIRFGYVCFFDPAAFLIRYFLKFTVILILTIIHVFVLLKRVICEYCDVSVLNALPFRS